MRSFCDQAPQPKRSKLRARTVLFLYFAAPVLAIPGIAYCGFEMVDRFYSEASAASDAPVADLSITDLMDAHVKASEGSFSQSELDHLRFLGSVFNGAQTLTFEGVSSRADGYSLLLLDRESQVSIELKGGTSHAPFDAVNAFDNSGDYLCYTLATIFSDLDHQAMHYLEKIGERIISVERIKVGREDLLQVTFATVEEATSALYFDEKSMQLVARRDFCGEEVVATFRYGDYKTVAGVALPHSVVAQMQGREPVRLYFQSLRVNNQPSGGLGRGSLALGELTRIIK